MGKCIFFIGEENEKGGFLMNSEMHFLPNVYSQENQVGNPDERIGRIGFGGFGRPGFGFGGFGRPGFGFGGFGRPGFGFGGFGRPGFGFGGFGRPGFGFGGFGGPFLGGLAGGLLAGTLLSPYGYGG